MAVPITDCSPHIPVTGDDTARTFQLDWWTESVYGLASAIETEGAFDRMPILADALEEAGCDDEVILRHCRECQHHEPDCWVLTTLLLPPSFPPRMEDLLDLKRHLASEVPVPDTTTGRVPGMGGVRFQSSRHGPDGQETEEEIGVEAGQVDAGYYRPMPSPFAVLLMMVIALLVICVLRFTLFAN